MRLAPWTKWRRIHRLQVFYAFFLYSLAGLYWLYVKDVVRFTRRAFGPYHNLRHSSKAWAGLLLGRLFVLTYTIALPIYLLRPTFGQFMVGYLTTMLIAGLLMALVFLLAHAVEGPDMMAAPASGHLEDSFFAHQLRTTADFACDNHLLSWLVGGLNFQVEHHLFPQVCSVHYPALRPIVRELAKKHGLPCHEFPSWGSALRAHIKHLQRLGAGPISP